MDVNASPQERLAEREKFVLAFNDTMVNIWKERITMLDVIDTGNLLNSVVAVKCNADGQYLHIELAQAFRTYGLWQDLGVGKEVYRGNPSDIGRDKVRKARPWFSTKYYRSVMNLKDFMTDNIAKEFLGVTSWVLDANKVVDRNSI